MGHGFVMCVSSLQQRAAISSCAIEAVTAYSRTMMMMIDVYTKVFQNGEEKEKFLKCTFVSSDLKDIGDIYYLQCIDQHAHVILDSCFCIVCNTGRG